MRDPVRTALAAWRLCLGLLLSVAVFSPSPATAAERPPGAAQPASDAAQVAGWVIATADNHGLPFMIIDKIAAEVLVFGADGKLRGAAPALLGLAVGDDSTPGIGDRKMSSIRPEERTTPAGRFVAAFGPAAGKKDVLWVDYATAISLHRVVTTNTKERRLQRLSTPTPLDNRITFGCINVSAAFYEKVARPTFTGTKGVVYVLPETRSLSDVFPTFQSRDPSIVASITGLGDIEVPAHAALAPNSAAVDAVASGGF